MFGFMDVFDFNGKKRRRELSRASLLTEGRIDEKRTCCGQQNATANCTKTLKSLPWINNAVMVPVKEGYMSLQNVLFIGYEFIVSW